MSVNDNVVQDKNANPVTDTVRQNEDFLVKDFAYALMHRPAWQVATAAVAPPLLATATVTTQVKSTNTTQLMVNFWRNARSRVQSFIG